MTLGNVYNNVIKVPKKSVSRSYCSSKVSELLFMLKIYVVYYIGFILVGHAQGHNPAKLQGS